MNIALYKLKQMVFGQYAGFLLLSAILLLSVLFPPFHKGSFTVCLFKNIFGFPSPGCGMTRAFLFLGHGNIHEAIRLNPNSLLAYSILIFLWLGEVIKIYTGREVKIRLTPQQRFLVYCASAGLMLAAWAYNLFLNPYV